MQTDRIEKFKKLLEEEIKRLSRKDYDLNVDEDGDEVDAAQCSLIVGMAYEQRSRSNDKLDRLNEALNKIKTGSFGICEECDSDISTKRLEICLDAKLCISCAELVEKEKRFYK